MQNPTAYIHTDPQAIQALKERLGQPSAPGNGASAAASFPAAPPSFPDRNSVIHAAQARAGDPVSGGFVPDASQLAQGQAAFDVAAQRFAQAGINVGRAIFDPAQNLTDQFGMNLDVISNNSTTWAGLSRSVAQSELNLGQTAAGLMPGHFQSAAQAYASGRQPDFAQTSLADTATHELTHQLGAALPPAQQERWEDLFAKAKPEDFPSVYAQQSPGEAWAEMGAAFLGGRKMGDSALTSGFMDLFGQFQHMDKPIGAVKGTLFGELDTTLGVEGTGYRNAIARLTADGYTPEAAKSRFMDLALPGLVQTVNEVGKQSGGAFHVDGLKRIRGAYNDAESGLSVNDSYALSVTATPDIAQAVTAGIGLASAQREMLMLRPESEAEQAAPYQNIAGGKRTASLHLKFAAPLSDEQHKALSTRIATDAALVDGSGTPLFSGNSLMPRGKSKSELVSNSYYSDLSPENYARAVGAQRGHISGILQEMGISGKMSISRDVAVPFEREEDNGHGQYDFGRGQQTIAGGRIQRRFADLVGRNIQGQAGEYLAGVGNAITSGLAGTADAPASPRAFQRRLNFSPAPQPAPEKDAGFSLPSLFNGADAASATDYNPAVDDARFAKSVVRGQWPGDDSKYTPDLSAPLETFLHGTHSKFNDFKKSTQDNSGLFGPGFYFTDNEKVAEGYAGTSPPQYSQETFFQDKKFVSDTARAARKAYKDDPEVSGQIPKDSKGAAEWAEKRATYLADVLSKQTDYTQPSGWTQNDRAFDSAEGFIRSEAANRIAAPNPIHKVALDIKNPFDINKTYSKPEMEKIVGAGEKAGLMDEGYGHFQQQLIKRDGLNSDLSAKGEDFYRALTSENNAEDDYSAKQVTNKILKKAGFDGITHVGGGRYNSNDPTRHRVMIAFDPKQVRELPGSPGYRGNGDVAQATDMGSEDRPYYGVKRGPDKNTATWKDIAPHLINADGSVKPAYFDFNYDGSSPNDYVPRRPGSKIHVENNTGVDYALIDQNYGRVAGANSTLNKASAAAKNADGSGLTFLARGSDEGLISSVPATHAIAAEIREGLEVGGYEGGEDFLRTHGVFEKATERANDAQFRAKRTGMQASARTRGVAIPTDDDVRASITASKPVNTLDEYVDWAEHRTFAERAAGNKALLTALKPLDKQAQANKSIPKGERKISDFPSTSDIIAGSIDPKFAGLPAGAVTSMTWTNETDAPGKFNDFGAVDATGYGAVIPGIGLGDMSQFFQKSDFLPNDAKAWVAKNPKRNYLPNYNSHSHRGVPNVRAIMAATGMKPDEIEAEIASSHIQAGMDETTDRHPLSNARGDTPGDLAPSVPIRQRHFNRAGGLGSVAGDDIAQATDLSAPLGEGPGDHQADPNVGNPKRNLRKGKPVSPEQAQIRAQVNAEREVLDEWSHSSDPQKLADAARYHDTPKSKSDFASALRTNAAIDTRMKSDMEGAAAVLSKPTGLTEAAEKVQKAAEGKAKEVTTAAEKTGDGKAGEDANAEPGLGPLEEGRDGKPGTAYRLHVRKLRELHGEMADEWTAKGRALDVENSPEWKEEYENRAIKAELVGKHTFEEKLGRQGTKFALEMGYSALELGRGITEASAKDLHGEYIAPEERLGNIARAVAPGAGGMVGAAAGFKMGGETGGIVGTFVGQAVGSIGSELFAAAQERSQVGREASDIMGSDLGSSAEEVKAFAGALRDTHAPIRQLKEAIEVAAKAGGGIRDKQGIENLGFMAGALGTRFNETTAGVYQALGSNVYANQFTAQFGTQGTKLTEGQAGGLEIAFGLAGNSQALDAIKAADRGAVSDANEVAARKKISGGGVKRWFEAHSDKDLKDAGVVGPMATLGYLLFNETPAPRIDPAKQAAYKARNEAGDAALKTARTVAPLLNTAGQQQQMATQGIQRLMATGASDSALANASKSGIAAMMESRPELKAQRAKIAAIVADEESGPSKDELQAQANALKSQLMGAPRVGAPNHLTDAERADIIKRRDEITDKIANAPDKSTIDQNKSTLRSLDIQLGSQDVYTAEQKKSLFDRKMQSLRAEGDLTALQKTLGGQTAAQMEPFWTKTAGLIKGAADNKDNPLSPAERAQMQGVALQMRYANQQAERAQAEGKINVGIAQAQSAVTKQEGRGTPDTVYAAQATAIDRLRELEGQFHAELSKGNLTYDERLQKMQALAQVQGQISQSEDNRRREHAESTNAINTADSGGQRAQSRYQSQIEGNKAFGPELMALDRKAVADTQAALLEAPKGSKEAAELRQRLTEQQIQTKQDAQAGQTYSPGVEFDNRMTRAQGAFRRSMEAPFLDGKDPLTAAAGLLDVYKKDLTATLAQEKKTTDPLAQKANIEREEADRNAIADLNKTRYTDVFKMLPEMTLGAPTGGIGVAVTPLSAASAAFDPFPAFGSYGQPARQIGAGPLVMPDGGAAGGFDAQNRAANPDGGQMLRVLERIASAVERGSHTSHDTNHLPIPNVTEHHYGLGLGFNAQTGR